MKEKAEATRRCAEITKAVKKRMRQLQRAGASFILCWLAYSEKNCALDVLR